MRIFISWSGLLSEKVAKVLKNWIPSVLPFLDPPFLSSEDITKGAQWAAELGTAINQCSYGIICLVPDNAHEPWINFEAGVISKAFTGSRVSPFLFGISPEQIDGPLSLFQCTTYSKEEIHRLVRSINTANKEAHITDERLNTIFETWWPQLRDDLDAIKNSDLPVAAGRTKLLKGRNEIYANAHQLLKLAEQRARVAQFFGGPRPPEGYAQEAARILKSKRDHGIEILYDAYLVIAPSRLPPNFDELIQKRYEIYEGEGVGDLLGLYLLEMEYPEGFGFDVFIVDRNHAHLSFTTSERLAALQRGITFENQPHIVGDLVEWFEQAIERNAVKNHRLRRKTEGA